MKKNDQENQTERKLSRRKFFSTLGSVSVGLLAAPYLKSTNILARGSNTSTQYLAKVAITKADNYTRAYVKQKVQYLFTQIDGISEIVKSGYKVAIKINLTGGGGLPDNMWTHPEVLRAVGELVIDCGVSPSNLYIVEALWSDASYNNYGYLTVQNSLGAKMVNLNSPAPYGSFIQKAVGSGSFNFSTVTMNQILSDVDVYISIPKMKQHYEAGVTCSLKNQVGIVPITSYTISNDAGRRGAIHHKSNSNPSNSYLPRSICDLNAARPVNLAIIDGIKNARGGEGTWNPTFKATEDHVLLAGKNPVATDSVAAFFMGNNPEADKLQLPGGGQCDNYLALLNQLGKGTNRMSEIEIVGDGADLITSVLPNNEMKIPNDFELYQNYPNPFNPSTTFRFHLPKATFVTIIIYNNLGQKIDTLIKGDFIQGVHEVHWTPNRIASGIYFCEMKAGGFSERMKMIYQK